MHLELRPIFRDVVLQVGVEGLAVPEPGDDRSWVSSGVAVQDHGGVDHTSNFFQHICDSHDHRRD